MEKKCLKKNPDLAQEIVIFYQRVQFWRHSQKMEILQDEYRFHLSLVPFRQNCAQTAFQAFKRKVGLFFGTISVEMIPFSRYIRTFLTIFSCQ